MKLAPTIFLAAAALSAGCLDTSNAPIAAPVAATATRLPDLASCDSLAAPEGSRLAKHVYAQGDQVYRWNGTSWVFVAPSAVLSADEGGNSTIGIHYAGPTWESVSGSKVVGAVAKRCPSNVGSIPWLLLEGTSSSGPGIFDGTTFIQRLNTTGGTAPATAGTVVGQEANVPYTAEYFFYKAQ